MNKKIIAGVVAACVLSVGTAFASTNPFADVSPNDWSYVAVKNLAEAGIIDGYSDGTFKGDKSITRYEMAQLVGKAIYRSNKVNAEQKAAIEKLATEYKDELQNLGVRMDNLENKTAG
ncbi:MAG: S-layer protein, partial [Firmicutes bacterium]|nr:S-layer protein [Bacillota bacterium]